MTNSNEIKTESKPSFDPYKTETLVTGGEPFKSDNKVNMEVKTETFADPDNNHKTIVNLSTPESGFKVKVVGPFNGEVEVLPGTELRAALIQLNKDDNTFGKYKYRDEGNDPVGIRSHVERDMILTSLPKA